MTNPPEAGAARAREAREPGRFSSLWTCRLRAAPKRWMKLTAPKRAGAPAPLPWRRWASMTRSRICSTALIARGSRPRYQRSRLGTERTHWRTGKGERRDRSDAPRSPPSAGRCTTGRTAPLAREGNQEVVPAVRASGPGEAWTARAAPARGGGRILAPFIWRCVTSRHIPPPLASCCKPHQASQGVVDFLSVLRARRGRTVDPGRMCHRACRRTSFLVEDGGEANRAGPYVSGRTYNNGRGQD